MGTAICLYCFIGLFFGVYFIAELLPDDAEEVKWIPTFITIFLCGPFLWFTLLIGFVCAAIAYFFFNLNLKEKLSSFYTKK